DVADALAGQGAGADDVLGVVLEVSAEPDLCRDQVEHEALTCGVTGTARMRCGLRRASGGSPRSAARAAAQTWSTTCPSPRARLARQRTRAPPRASWATPTWTSPHSAARRATSAANR